MGTTVADYLRGLGPGLRPELPETTAGTLRLDAREDGRTEHWLLTIADQHVEVSRSAEDADLVVRADRSVFDEMATGHVHVSAALLRNDLTVQGDIRLLNLLRRIFPGPPGARHPRTVAREVMEGRTGVGGWGAPR
ncbi:SCP2 sterol-binding domain-containing protein [Micromonospora sp. WMMD812]|uniref:SCP2 sterol-binding domain-containing protein n=1 Tax=Micromonospora sp. WMMD812 TaxID=3015152 RepID=UPI00248AAEDB|nr:SCP2 sterol-binding domain-containing protein [Micromonospora sp. WMMD812]WBB69930.1 SCP2 sterol-binding domain-containing protein [Micromonospora sp. WMMD812]